MKFLKRFSFTFRYSFNHGKATEPKMIFPTLFENNYNLAKMVVVIYLFAKTKNIFNNSNQSPPCRYQQCCVVKARVQLYRKIVSTPRHDIRTLVQQDPTQPRIQAANVTMTAMIRKATTQYRSAEISVYTSQSFTPNARK